MIWIDMVVSQVMGVPHFIIIRFWGLSVLTYLFWGYGYEAKPWDPDGTLLPSWFVMDVDSPIAIF